MTDGTGTDQDLEPEEPSEAGVSEAEPDVSHVEAARLLADQAGERLEAQGFDREEIRKWADAYAREEGSGDVDDLVEWIARQEHTG
ncbi:MAG TPA: hypothetical protein VK923_16655 [Euzebyales bacterium]|nr:hypothetical protein [Euzebyales bacterium]